ncbi:MAG: DHH family phosphoesterase [Spirochaetaceae bacterium]|jgi:nanoRNase/pAp phosphatase (c-di-AMP/oligoRNAs hydrolase)|nr:DHH family phosphoesterase [Spirochaetaceae bacterium]
MMKTEIQTIAEKNRRVDNIIEAIQKNDFYLLLGHKDPDTDCVASLVAFALLLGKFQKEAAIFFAGPVQEQFNYLLAICKYNNIAVSYGKELDLQNISTVVILDTPKPDMIAKTEAIARLLEDPSIRKIEIDHHLHLDAQYAGDPGYCLVSNASSTCELLAYLSLKFAKKLGIKADKFFPRNIALALLTGMVMDSQMGKYLKTSRERWYYRIFTGLFERLLFEKTIKGKGNLASMEAIFDVIQRFSVQEKKAYDEIMALKRKSPSVQYVFLDKAQSQKMVDLYGTDLVVNISKAAADILAEENGRLGMVAYYDDDARSDFIQFRLRRSSRFSTDLREILAALDIRNGGGHPGAVGFRVKKDEVPDLTSYTENLIARIEELVPPFSLNLTHNSG